MQCLFFFVECPLLEVSLFLICTAFVASPYTAKTVSFSSILS